MDPSFNRYQASLTPNRSSTRSTRTSKTFTPAARASIRVVKKYSSMSPRPVRCPPPLAMGRSYEKYWTCRPVLLRDLIVRLDLRVLFGCQCVLLTSPLGSYPPPPSWSHPASVTLLVPPSSFLSSRTPLLGLLGPHVFLTSSTYLFL